MNVGVMAWFDDADDESEVGIDGTWFYAGVLMSIPSTGAEDFIPRTTDRRLR